MFLCIELGVQTWHLLEVLLISNTLTISCQRERCSLKLIVEATCDQWKSKGFLAVKKLTVCPSSKMSQPSMGPHHLGLEHITLLPEVKTGDAHLRLHLPPSFSQFTL